MKSKMMRGEEIAEILNISRAHAFRLMSKGIIPSIRIGKCIRVRPDDLIVYIKKNSIGHELVAGDEKSERPLQTAK